jgi:hypothetical protein
VQSLFEGLSCFQRMSHPRVEILSSSSDDEEAPPVRRVLNDEPTTKVPPRHAKEDDDPVVGRRKPGPKIPVPKDLVPGVRVTIHSLVNAKEYNGYPSVILEPNDKERTGELGLIFSPFFF